jgi:hypothetical protein
MSLCKLGVKKPWEPKPDKSWLIAVPSKQDELTPFNHADYVRVWREHCNKIYYERLDNMLMWLHVLQYYKTNHGCGH